ncbi:MAG: 6-phosphofructokinase [Planctomycetota bacterium]|nr:6-phosphofructokinase [Planctomycetota bacterium]
MANMIKGNAVIGQSGGPTAVINQSLVGVIETVGRCRSIKRLLGARHGVRGIIEQKFMDLKGLKKPLLDRIAVTPAAALGSSRDKPDEAYCRKIFKVFARYDVRYFFYIGGNDSADTARIVNEMAAASDYELRVFHIPKTIDNDLCVTDHCPGYGSAARFVASAFMGDDRDVTSLPGIKINVVMGRNAGWLTAAAALGRAGSKDGPHLLYTPEAPFSTRRFLDDVRRVYDRLGRCQIAVSEGIVERGGKPVTVALAEKLGAKVERDSHGNVQLSGSGALGDFLAQYIKTQAGRKKLRVRADTFGYLQRSFPGFASAVDAAEARACGRKATEYAMAGDADGSVAIRRGKGAHYTASFFRAELKDVARRTKDMPRSFINKAGNGVTRSFIKYASPLAGTLPTIGKLV